MTPKALLSFFRFLYNRLIPCLFLGAVLLGLYCLTQRLEATAADLLMRGTAKPAHQSPVVLVLIDDESIKRLMGRFGPLFWQRSAYLDIFRRIQTQQPAVMVFDAHLINMNRKEDAQIFEAMQAFPHLISGLALDSPSVLNTNHPLYYHLKLGVVNTAMDSIDGTVRSLQPVFHDAQGVFPSLSVSAVLEYLQARHPTETWATDSTPGQLLLFPEEKPGHSLRAQLTPDGKMLLRWYRLLPGGATFGQSHPSIPLWALYEPSAYSPSLLKNKIVLLGASSTVYRDYLKTPLHEHHLGVDIHATAIDNLLFSQGLTRIGAPVQVTLLVFFCGLVCFIRMRLKSFGKTILCTTSLMVLYLYVAFHQFVEAGQVWDLVTPEMFMLVGLFLGTTVRVMADDQQVRAMEQSLSQLVSQSVFHEIRRVGYVLRPGGQRMEITSMFVDIRNFSAMAETMPPKEVTQLLNAFYTEVEKITFAHRGTVDKFMGDGILVIFGAPIPIEDHADHAMAAAQEILKATEALAQRWQAEKNIQVEMGISLNSGPVFAGFLGPVYKLEYTAIGDTVNLCIRLQEQNKQFQTRLVVSEYTVERLSQAAPLVELGEVSVKGREGSLKIYSL